MREIVNVSDRVPFDDEERFDRPFTAIREKLPSEITTDGQPYLIDDQMYIKKDGKEYKLIIESSEIKFKEI